MNLTPELVESIVQRVLAHLGTAGIAGPAAGAAANERVSRESAPAADERPGHFVQIAEKVVTQAVLADAVNGESAVRIGPQAILTPSARDFIRSRRIDVIRETPSSKTANRTHWHILVTNSTPQIAPF